MAKEMPAGREMDVLIAENIMGWAVHQRNTAWWVKVADGNEVTTEVMGFTYGKDRFAPSTNIADAWEVVKRMPIPFKLEKCWEKAYQIGPEGWSACWCTDADCEGCNENSRCTNGDDAWAETAPLAICRYALKVAGVKINGDS